MALHNQDPPPLTVKVVFDGLDTERGELLLESFTSPDLENVSFNTYGTMESRLGSSILTVCYDFEAGTNPHPSGTATYTKAAPIYILSRHTDGGNGGLLMNITEHGAWQGRVNALSVTDNTNQTRIFNPIYYNGEKGGGSQAVFVDEVDISDTTTWVYKGACMYLTRRGQLPVIHCGGTGPSLSATGGQITQIVTVAPMTVTCTSAHGLSDMDIVRITSLDSAEWAGYGATNWYEELEGHDFYIKVDNSNQYRLYDMNMQPFGNPSVGVGVVCTSGATYRTTDNSGDVIPMPRGIYSTTAAVRGYPARWIDPNGDLSNSYTDWPDEDITSDWPRWTTYIGVGPGSRDDNQLSSRLLAYGFQLDPDRIDYSALGTPYNFLKDDPTTGNTEAAADTNLALDGGYFYASRGDGDEVVHVIEHMGFLIVFKKFKTIVYSGEIGQFFRVEKVYNVGAISHDAVVRVGNEIYFWSFDGPRKLTVTDQYADLLEGMVGQYVIEKVRDATAAYLPNIVGRHERLARRVIWAYTASGSSNNANLVHYYPEAGRETWSYFEGGYTNVQYLAEYFNPSTLQQQFIYTGTNATDDAHRIGRVYELNSGNDDEYTGSGTAREITTYYITRWFDAGDPTEVVRALDLTVLVGEKGTTNCNFYIGWDYSEDWLLMDIPIRSYSGSAGRWNLGHWNDSTWNASGRSALQLRAMGKGRIFRLKVEATTAPIGIHGLILNLSRKGTR